MECLWEENRGQGWFAVCHDEAVEQFIYMQRDGSHVISDPYCARHSEKMQPSETVTVLPLWRST